MFNDEKLIIAYLIYGICSSLQPGAGAEMCSGATVTAKDTREKAELSQGGKWEKSGKILMTRYHFWLNCKITSSDLQQSVFKYESHLPGGGAREAQRRSIVGEISKYCFFF